jgi:hypothetical protein
MALAQVQVNTGDLKHALKTHAEFFIQFHLGELLTLAIPIFHPAVFAKMIAMEISRFVCAIPRGHAKTTLAKLACVWYFWFTDYRFIVYVSNTASTAQLAALDIINFLESENSQSIFPIIEWEIRRPGDGLYVFHIGNKKCILRALGAGQQIRGINIDNQRPQLAIVDDLEDNDNIATKELLDKLIGWFYGPFEKCLDLIHNKIIHIGNMISNQCLLKKHCEDPDWHSIRFGCLLSDGTPLWPDIWPVIELQKDFQRYVRMNKVDSWFAEMMNLPMASSSGLIRASEIYYRPQIYPGNHDAAFITIDPAISERSWAHKSVVACSARFDGVWQAVDYELLSAVDPIMLFESAYKMAIKWRCRHIGIESMAYQASIEPVFKFLSEMRGIKFLEFHKLMSYKQKTERILTFAGMLKIKEFALNDGEYPITVQLLEYNPSKRDNDDDIIDAYGYAPEMIAQGKVQLITKAKAVASLIKTSYETCDI